MPLPIATEFLMTAVARMMGLQTADYIKRFKRGATLTIPISEIEKAFEAHTTLTANHHQELVQTLRQTIQYLANAQVVHIVEAPALAIRMQEEIMLAHRASNDSLEHLWREVEAVKSEIDALRSRSGEPATASLPPGDDSSSSEDNADKLSTAGQGLPDTNETERDQVATDEKKPRVGPAEEFRQRMQNAYPDRNLKFD